MPDNRKKIKEIIGITAGIWFISLLVFLIYCYSEGGVKLWYVSAYAIFLFFLFSVSYWRISRIVNQVMEKADDCIQSLIDGKPVLHFSQEEESLLGKFQMQIMKLYRIMDRARVKEEKMRKDMGDMVADLVHQVNTPLTNIQMYSGFLVQDGLPGEERSQICDVIDAQVEKLGWFAAGFEKAARLEGDIMQLKPEKQPVLDMVLGAIDQITLKAQQHRSEILLEGNQDICAWYDRRWTEEALFNLLDNAVKYGDKGTQVIVEMAAYDLFVRIDVKNCGYVIPKEDYNRLFTRFYRGSNAALIKEGVGLGLYLARKIVTEQGGYMKVGQYGHKGNTFSIFLRQ